MLNQTHRTADGDYVADPERGLVHQLGGCETTACGLDQLLDRDDPCVFESVTAAERCGYSRHCCVVS